MVGGFRKGNMGENSKIEWTDHTFNPWIGCTKVSSGCANCYAETRMDHRFNVVKWGKGQPRKRTSNANWKLPLQWNKAEESKRVDHAGFVAAKKPRVFCASLADWLDDEVPAEWLFDLITLIHKTPSLDWLLLTKRPENFMSRLLAAASQCTIDPLDVVDRIEAWISGDRIPLNVWIGTSVENQETADTRIPHLLKIPAKIRFLSMEPLLGPVNLHNRHQCDADCWMSNIHWVIVGGESGPGARPMNKTWVRNIKNQCGNIPFLFKQWGGVNKKLTGRELDGRTWDELPV